jgi:hypothetical protein
MTAAETLDVINHHRKEFFTAIRAGMSDEDFRKAIEVTKELGLALVASAERSLKKIDKDAAK